MNITIDSKIQNIIMRLGGVDYPISTLKFSQNGSTPAPVWQHEAQSYYFDVNYDNEQCSVIGDYTGEYYEDGTLLSATVTMYEGYTFNGWYKNGTLVGSDATYTFQIHEDTTLDVSTDVLELTVSISVNDDNYGSADGDGVYSYGELVTVTAYPNYGYSFVGWYVLDTLLSSEETYSFNIYGDTPLEAVFEAAQEYTVNVTVNDDDYGYVDDVSGTYTEGDTVWLEAYPNYGYAFEGWYVNGSLLSDEASYSFEIYDDMDIEAVFYALQTYELTLTVNDDTYGSVDGGGTYVDGETVTITATKNTGYKFVGWYEYGDLLSSSATYEVTVDSDRDIEAVFEAAQQFTITCLSNDTSMGHISGSTTVYEQDECLLEAINEDGYAIDHWEVNGTTVSNSSYYSFYPTANTTVTAIFTQDYYATEYFTIEPQTNGSIKFTKKASAPNKTWYYSTNKTNWTSFNKTTTINVSANTKYYFYSSGVCGSSTSAYWVIDSTNVKFSVSGNILSLYKGSSFSNKSITNNYAFSSLFNNSTKLVSAKNLVIDFTTTSIYVFCYLFYKCSSLTKAPKLPSTSLGSYCYRNMFASCTSLTTAPELPATTMNAGVYQYMFSGCSSLNYIKCLGTNPKTSDNTGNWVSGVAATGTFIKNSSTTWPTGISGIPSGWTVQNA